MHKARLTIAAISGLASPWAGAQTLTTLVDSGPTSNRVDIVFLGDGYTQQDLDAGLYTQHINNQLDYIFTDSALVDPLYRYRNYFNVHAVQVVSNESGADDPNNDTYVDTALNGSYAYNGGADRLLYISTFRANTARNAALAGQDFFAEMQFVTINSSKYGGGGGSWAVYAGANGSANELALHEVGHSFFGLADEYAYGGSTVYTGSEPGEPNVTTDPNTAKWSQWVGYDQPGVGVIGAYEGARYSEEGIYRPSNNSKMRSLGQPFDAVSREEIILDLYNYVDPLDSWTPNGSTLTDPGELMVQRIDDTTINLQWFVDDQLIAVDQDAFNLADFGFGPGAYEVTARGYDPTGFDPVAGWVRKDTDKLEQFIEWDVTLTQVVAPLAGDFNGDGLVDAADLAIVLAGFGSLATPGDHAQGEWTGDGRVDQAELNLVLRNWTGQSPPGVTIPEPGALAMVLLGLPMIARRRRRG